MDTLQAKLVRALYADLRDMIGCIFKPLSQHPNERELAGICDVDLLNHPSITSPRQLAACMQYVALFKKFSGKGIFSDCVTNDDRASAAMDEFRAANAIARAHHSSGLPVPSDVSRVFDLAREIIHSRLEGAELGTPNLEALAPHMRPGAGASSDTPYCDAFRKISEGPLTATNRITYIMYRGMAMIASPTSKQAEVNRHSLFGVHDKLNSKAKLLTVRKTATKDRLISKIPSCNMMLQLAVHNAMTAVLASSFKIDLARQQNVNGHMAWLGSVKGGFATLDLKSASDLNTPWLVRQLLPREWYNFLMTIGVQELDYKGEIISLHSIAPMGCGYTFALMTLVIAALVEATYRANGLSIRDHKGDLSYAVYGDDIIVRESVYGAVVRVLRTAGFILNDKKSFCDGKFRESCGKDFYDGYPVRPVYVEKLSTIQDCFSTYNRIVRWAARHSFKIYNTAHVLTCAVPIKDRQTVPPFEDDCAGFHTSGPVLRYNTTGASLRKNLGVNTGSFVYKCWRPRRKAFPLWEYEYIEESIHLLEVICPSDKARSIIFYGERPPGYLEHFGTYLGTTQVKKLSVKRELFDNPDGVLLCILGGYVDSAGVLVRNDSDFGRYEVSRWLITPSWCAAPGDPRFSGWQPSHKAWIALVDELQAVVPI